MKAILVMEIPESCAECPCCDECVEMCRHMDSPIIEVNGECGKPDWCPLVPMLERKEEMTLKEAVKETFKYGASCGWNACLDAIERAKG